MPKKVTIIRHAQSLFNSGQARSDDIKNCRLSEYGKATAQNIEHNFDILIISPLRRAIETYANSKIKTNDIIISHLFREHKSWKVNMLDNEDENITESNNELKERVKKSLDFLKELKGENIGVISHHDFIHAFCDQIFGQKINVGNCNYVSFEL